MSISKETLVELRQRVKLAPDDALEPMLSLALALWESANSSAEHVDAKMAGLLGYGVALIALLGVSDLPRSGPFYSLAVLFSVGCGMVAIGYLTHGLWTRPWKSLGVSVLGDDRFSNADQLKRYYINALAESAHYAKETNEIKAKSLRAGESWLLLSGLLAGATLLVRLSVTVHR